MAQTITSAKFEDVVGPLLRSLMDNAALISSSVNWNEFVPKPDEMQSLFDLSEEAADGRTRNPRTTEA